MRPAQHRGADRPADAVRHRADEGRDGRQRRGLAFAPADMPAGRDAHEQRILAAVGLGRDLRHRQIEEIDRFDFHGVLPWSMRFGRHELRVEDGAGRELDVLVERIHGPGADRVPEALQIGRGRARRIDIEVLLDPGVVHVVLGVRRLDHDQVEVLRIEAVGE